MNEKERIIELVKNKVISMEEALDLLEAAKRDDLAEDLNDQAIEKDQHDHRTTDNRQETDAKIAELKAALSKNQESLTIAQQRLREVEVLVELEGESSELSQQSEQLTAEINDLKEKEATIEQELNQLSGSHKSYQDIRTTLNDNAKKYSQTARDFANESKKLGQSLRDQVNDFVKGFSSKDVNLSFKIPWVRTQKLNHTFDFSETNFEDIDVRLFNGSMTVKTSEDDQAHLSAELRLHGNFEEASVDDFMRYAKLEVNENTLVLDIQSPYVSMDGILSVPAKAYKAGRFELTNGDLVVKGIEVKSLDLINRNGDIRVADCHADKLDLDNLNGDINVESSDIDMIMISCLNGDIRLEDNLKDVTVDGNNSDIYVTKRNQEVGKLRINTLSGDIKVAIPKALGLKGKVKSNQGKVQSRLDQVTTMQATKSFTFDRGSENGQVELALETMIGNIFLKDTEF